MAEIVALVASLFRLIIFILPSEPLSCLKVNYFNFYIPFIKCQIFMFFFTKLVILQKMSTKKQRYTLICTSFEDTWSKIHKICYLAQSKETWGAKKKIQFSCYLLGDRNMRCHIWQIITGQIHICENLQNPQTSGFRQNLRFYVTNKHPIASLRKNGWHVKVFWLKHIT